jgi:hypothetical protein
VLLVLISVFEVRMEGRQELGVKGATLTLASAEIKIAVTEADAAIRSGAKLTSVGEFEA